MQKYKWWKYQNEEITFVVCESYSKEKEKERKKECVRMCVDVCYI